VQQQAEEIGHEAVAPQAVNRKPRRPMWTLIAFTTALSAPAQSRSESFLSPENVRQNLFIEKCDFGAFVDSKAPKIQPGGTAPKQYESWCPTPQKRHKIISATMLWNLIIRYATLYVHDCRP